MPVGKAVGSGWRGGDGGALVGLSVGLDASPRFSPLRSPGRSRASSLPAPRLLELAASGPRLPGRGGCGSWGSGFSCALGPLSSRLLSLGTQAAPPRERGGCCCCCFYGVARKERGAPGGLARGKGARGSSFAPNGAGVGWLGMWAYLHAHRIAAEVCKECGCSAVLDRVYSHSVGRDLVAPHF